MQNSRFGRRRYVDAVQDEVEDEDGETSNNHRQNIINRARKQAVELQREAVRKKFFFQQKTSTRGEKETTWER